MGRDWSFDKVADYVAGQTGMTRFELWMHDSVNERPHRYVDPSGVLSDMLSLCNGLDKIIYIEELWSSSGKWQTAPVEEYIVQFRKLEKPRENYFSAKMASDWSHEKVFKRVLHEVGLKYPTRLGLWSHDSHTQKPHAMFYYFEEPCDLSYMLSLCNPDEKILYFQVLPLKTPTFPYDYRTSCSGTFQIPKRRLIPASYQYPEKIEEMPLHKNIRLSPCDLPSSGASQVATRNLFAEKCINLERTYSIHFRRLEKPEEDLFCAKMGNDWSYERVVKMVTGQMGLKDSTRLRLWSHNPYTKKPHWRFNLKEESFVLFDMLILCHPEDDVKILYIEELPPLKVAFHHMNKEEVSIHDIPQTGDLIAGDIIETLKSQIVLSDKNAEIRLVELHDKKIRVIGVNEHICFQNYINNSARSMHAEEILEMEKNIKPGKFNLRIVGYKAEEGTMPKIPKQFICEYEEGDTLSNIKTCLHEHLGFSQREIENSKFIFTSPAESKELKDTDLLSNVFQKHVTRVWTEYIHWEYVQVPKDKKEKRKREISDGPLSPKKIKGSIHMEPNVGTCKRGTRFCGPTDEDEDALEKYFQNLESEVDHGFGSPLCHY